MPSAAEARRARDDLEDRWGNSVPNSVAESAYRRGGESAMKSAVLEYARSRSPSKARQILDKSGGGAPGGAFRSALESVAGSGGDTAPSSGSSEPQINVQPDPTSSRSGKRAFRDELEESDDRASTDEKVSAEVERSEVLRRVSQPSAEQRMRQASAPSAGGGAEVVPVANFVASLGIWETLGLGAIVAGIIYWAVT